MRLGRLCSSGQVAFVADYYIRRMKRIGVAFPGDPSQPATWSGTPAGVMRGLTEAGAQAVAIRTEPGRLVRGASFNLVAATYLRPDRDIAAAVRRARRAARASTAIAAVTSWAAPTPGRVAFRGG